MIVQVAGTLIAKELDRIEILTDGGVAYELAVPLNAYEALPKAGERCAVHTFLVVKEDGWQLFGFTTTHERRVFQKVLGLGYDVAFSPAPSELDHATIAARAREESDISTFLMDWLGPIPDGDPIGLARLIWQEHPGYAADPVLSRADIQARIAEIARLHRSADGAARGHRMRQMRIAEL